MPQQLTSFHPHHNRPILVSFSSHATETSYGVSVHSRVIFVSVSSNLSRFTDSDPEKSPFVSFWSQSLQRFMIFGSFRSHSRNSNEIRATFVTFSCHFDLFRRIYVTFPSHQRFHYTYVTCPSIDSFPSHTRCPSDAIHCCLISTSICVSFQSHLFLVGGRATWNDWVERFISVSLPLHFRLIAMAIVSFASQSRSARAVSEIGM